MRRGWLVIWGVSAAVAATGVLLLYLQPLLFSLGTGYGKDSVPGPDLGRSPYVLLGIGIVGLVAGTAGIWRSGWRLAADRSARGTIAADTASAGGAAVAVAALIVVILAQFVWPGLAASLSSGPCDSNPQVACFRAHPDFYQEESPGSLGFSTPASRFYDSVVGPSVVTAFLLGLAAGVACALGLAAGTRRRRTAILGVTIGSLTVVALGGEYLLFLIAGGGE